MILRISLFLLSFFATAAQAGTYGAENWGEMYWGDNPVTAPIGSPTIQSAVASEDQITITLGDFPQGNGDDGWSAITSYVVTCGATSVETTENSVVITGLSDDTEYSCSVTASNAVGEGPATVRVVTTEGALRGMNFLLICSAIDCRAT